MTKIAKLEERVRNVQVYPSLRNLGEATTERERLEEERESTKQCLAICTKVLEHIGQFKSNLSEEFHSDVISILGGLMLSNRATANSL
jgi:hypothetical protein